MDVRLLYNTPAKVIVIAARTCTGTVYDSQSSDHFITPKDTQMIRALIAKGHESVLEHVVYTFSIKGLSRAALQELARHRIASLSVKSTRWTLRELMKEPRIAFGNAHKYLFKSASSDINDANILALEAVREKLSLGWSNDKVKYGLPEAFLTDLIWTVNVRSLRNFLKLRSSKRALDEMRILALRVWEAIPEVHAFMFNDVFTLDDYLNGEQE